MECPEASIKIENGDEAEIDFNTGEITNLSKKETYRAMAFPDFIKEIMADGGLMNNISK